MAKYMYEWTMYQMNVEQCYHVLKSVLLYLLFDFEKIWNETQVLFF